MRGCQQNTQSASDVCIISIHQCQHAMNVCLPCLLLNLMVYYLISGLRKATRRAGEEMSDGFILILVQMASCEYENIC